MTALGIIPARGGSKKVPRKNIRMLAGKPLIAWTIEAALASPHITELIVSSDDADILKVAAEWGATPLLRPAELAQDDSPTLPALQHAVQWAEWAGETTYDVIAHLPCTNALRTTADIDNAFSLLDSDKDIESVIGMTQIQGHHPARVKRLVNGVWIREFCVKEPQNGQRQLLEPKAYVRNGSIYLVKRDALMGPQGRLFDHFYSKAYVMPEERSVNIDTEIDFALCELLLRQREEANGTA